jgi:hypothetical protein
MFTGGGTTTNKIDDNESSRKKETTTTTTSNSAEKTKKVIQIKYRHFIQFFVFTIFCSSAILLYSKMKDSEDNTQITENLSVEDIFDICVKEGCTFGGEALTKDKVIKPAEVRLLGKNRGLCSIVYSIKFFLADKTCSLVTKIPTVQHLAPSEDEKISDEERDRKTQETFEMVSQLHANELLFYSYFKNGRIQGLKIPAFVFGKEMTEKQEGLILMEDFSADEEIKTRKEDETYEGLQYLNDQQIKEAIVEIAKLQAIGFIMPNGKEKLGKLDVVQKDLTSVHEETLREFAKLKLPFATESRMKELKEQCQRSVFEKNCQSNVKVNLPSVLCHNDFWTKNVIYSPSNGSLLSIIDWQTVRYASPTHDIAALLALELEGEKRREYQKLYLEFYLHQLKESLDHYGVKDDGGLRDANIDDLMIAYKDSLKVAIYGVIFTLVNFDKQLEGHAEARESPLVDRVHYLLDDLYPIDQ